MNPVNVSAGNNVILSVTVPIDALNSVVLRRQCRFRKAIHLVSIFLIRKVYTEQVVSRNSARNNVILSVIEPIDALNRVVLRR